MAEAISPRAALRPATAAATTSGITSTSSVSAASAAPTPAATYSADSTAAAQFTPMVVAGNAARSGGTQPPPSSGAVPSDAGSPLAVAAAGGKAPVPAEETGADSDAPEREPPPFLPLEPFDDTTFAGGTPRDPASGKVGPSYTRYRCRAVLSLHGTP